MSAEVENVREQQLANCLYRVDANASGSGHEPEIELAAGQSYWIEAMAMAMALSKPRHVEYWVKCSSSPDLRPNCVWWRSQVEKSGTCA